MKYQYNQYKNITCNYGSAISCLRITEVTCITSIGPNNIGHS